MRYQHGCAINFDVAIDIGDLVNKLRGCGGSDPATRIRGASGLGGEAAQRAGVAPATPTTQRSATSGPRALLIPPEFNRLPVRAGEYRADPAADRTSEIEFFWISA